MFNTIIQKINGQELTIKRDEDITLLKIELFSLEKKFDSAISEKAELEKLLADFQYRHSIELGDIILRILEIKKVKYKKNSSEYEETKKDYKEYSEQLYNEKKKIRNNLTNEEAKELKQKFRKASFLCHPDKVAEELKDVAGGIFHELKTAYEMNDIKKVNEILIELETGVIFNPKSILFTEKEKLELAIEKLRLQILEVEKEINEIRNSETYRTIISIENWDIYFIKTKDILQIELDHLSYPA